MMWLWERVERVLRQLEGRELKGDLCETFTLKLKQLIVLLYLYCSFKVILVHPVRNWVEYNDFKVQSPAKLKNKRFPQAHRRTLLMVAL